MYKLAVKESLDKKFKKLQRKDKEMLRLINRISLPACQLVSLLACRLVSLSACMLARLPACVPLYYSIIHTGEGLRGN